MTLDIHVVGGGLAGSEAAWQLAQRGHSVVLHEMRGVAQTPAHKTDRLAELVCSNTFKSTELVNAHGLLKAEMRVLGSVVLECADAARVPGGTALTVDRDRFSREVDRRVRSHPGIRVERGEVAALPEPGIIATGPLTSAPMTEALQRRLGSEALAFYDAIAPIVAGDSVDRSMAFQASRYDKETMALGPDAAGAYLNCPFTRDEYEAFIDALVAADQYPGQSFDPVPYFEGCMPIEEMARRGRETLRFGPLKPVGLTDPRTGRRPYAVVQLRMEDDGGRMWNLVGCQTRMRIADQQRVLRLIPGLRDAEFLRYGAIHRNSYINAPASLSPHLALRDAPSTLIAGQLTGVEGYTESAASGLLAGINLSRIVRGEEPIVPPPTTMLGGLFRYLRDADAGHFQPMNANFGLLEDLANPPRDKRLKREQLSARALAAMREWCEAHLVEIPAESFRSSVRSAKGGTIRQAEC